MPDGDEVQFKSPTTGAVQVVPPEHWDEAMKQGYTPTTHTVMYSPEGQRGMVPNEQLAEKMKAGYQTTPKTQFEKDRTEGPRGVVNALKTMAPQDPTGGHGLFSSEGLFGEKGSWGFNPTGKGTAYSDLTRSLPKDLPTNVLSGDKPGSDNALGRGLYRGASLFAPLAGGSAENMEEASARGDTSGVATQAAVPIGTAIAGAAVRPLRAKIGASKALESVPTRSIGDVIEQPSKAPAYALRKAFPEPAERVTAREGAANAAELEKRMTDVETARQKELADMGRLNKQDAPLSRIPTRMPKAEPPVDVPTERPIGAPLPDAGEFYEHRGTDLMKREAQEKALGGQEPIGSKIVSPAVGEPRFTGSEGRAATWTNQDVMRLAQQGNREAIQQAIRRGMELPPGARYVMGDPDFGRAVYNPREVTQFTPEGAPIRNAENPTVKAPRERIQIPQAEPAAKESINAATGEVTRPQEAIGEPMPETKQPIGLGRGQMQEEIPSQPVSLQEIEDISRRLGRTITAAEVPEILRREAAEKNISEGLSGNRRDAAGDIREKHRAKLEKKGKR